MGSIFLWWLVVLVMGLAAFPIAFVALRHLPDKGYFFSKVLGLLLTGYLTWLFGYFSYGGGTILFSFLILAAVSGYLLWNWIGKPFWDSFRKNLFFFIVMEGLFLTAFLVAGAYKMRTHDIAGQEKPMDFTFINGILASHSMPPQDPWLSGGSISYYYFGYFIIAMLCKATSGFVTSGEGYNLGVALTWALAIAGGFSMGYALTRRYRYSFLSAACLAVLGNLDYWHRAIQSYQVGDLTSPYYNNPANPAVAAGLTGFFNFLLSPLQHSWDYFQASRIVPVGTDKLINEFPSFSFFLSDLHPHVMAIPFVLLAMALAFNLLKAPAAGLRVFVGQRPWSWLQWALLALVFGGLGFLNSWDFPTLTFLLGLSLFLQQAWAQELDFGVWFKSVATIGIPVIVGAFILYLPFYVRLQSQAQGIGFVGSRTGLYYLAVIFGLFFSLFFPVLVARSSGLGTEKNPKSKAKKSNEIECALCGQEGTGKTFCGNCGGDLAAPPFSEVTPLPDEESRRFLGELGAWFSGGFGTGNGWVTLGIIVPILLVLNMDYTATVGNSFLPLRLGSFALALLFLLFCVSSIATKSASKEMVFATLLVGVGFFLIAGCEIFYMKDLFSGGNNQSGLHRMNTVFKFHYQVWILFSVASGPFLKWLLENLWPQWVSWKKVLWAAVAGLFFFGALMYPLLAFTSRMRGGASDVVTLDGSVFYDHLFPADYQAAQWIKENIKPVFQKVPVAGLKVPVILEAWGDSYMTKTETSGGRIATLTGYPTLLGWAWHEVQWRGTSDHAVVRGGSDEDTIQHRETDIDSIYTSSDLDQTRALLKKYGVDYAYLGEVERQKYKEKLNAGKFSQLGAPVFSTGSSTLYKINP